LKDVRASDERVGFYGQFPMGTLTGLGFQREAPRPRYVPPVRLDPARLRAQEALKKCMFIPPVRDLVRGAAIKPVKKQAPKPVVREGAAARSWLDDPLVVGLLLAFLPPLGFVLLWTSPRYTSEARRAISLMMGLTMVLVTLVVTAFTLV